jgi:hypothetical protein
MQSSSAFKTSGDLYEFVPIQSSERDEEDTKLIHSIRSQQTKAHDIDYSPVDPAKSYQFFEVNSKQESSTKRRYFVN